jgi:hypothetical protein
VVQTTTPIRLMSRLRRFYFTGSPIFEPLLVIPKSGTDQGISFIP